MEVAATAILFYLPLIYMCQMGLVVGCLRMSCLCNFHLIVFVVCTHFENGSPHQSLETLSPADFPSVRRSRFAAFFCPFRTFRYGM